MQATDDQPPGRPRVSTPTALTGAAITAAADKPRLFEGLRLELQERGADDSCAQVAGKPTARACTLGRVQLLKVTGESLDLETEGNTDMPGVATLILLEGSARIVQGSRETELSAGDLCLMRSGRPLRLWLNGNFRAALVEAPEAEIADRFPLWRAAMLTPIPGKSGVSAVFRDAVRSMHRWRETLTGEGGERLADAVIDLMGALVCFAVPVNGECIRQSLYQKDQVKKVIQLNLRNPELSVDLIASTVGLSPRQVHRLFLDEGVSLMRWVWVQRLEQCYRELTQGEADNRSISDIAYTWGFNDSSHFSRAFRKQYGISPREARRQPMSDPLRV